MKPFNESDKEYIREKTILYAKILRKVFNDLKIIKSNDEVWHIAEKEVIERYKKGEEL